MFQHRWYGLNVFCFPWFPVENNFPWFPMISSLLLVVKPNQIWPHGSAFCWRVALARTCWIYPFSWTKHLEIQVPLNGHVTVSKQGSPNSIFEKNTSFFTLPENWYLIHLSDCMISDCMIFDLGYPQLGDTPTFAAFPVCRRKILILHQIRTNKSCGACENKWFMWIW